MPLYLSESLITALRASPSTGTLIRATQDFNKSHLSFSDIPWGAVATESFESIFATSALFFASEIITGRLFPVSSLTLMCKFNHELIIRKVDYFSKKLPASSWQIV